MCDETLPPCPECSEPYTYEQGSLLVCPVCGHEWSPEDTGGDAADAPVIRDAVGSVLVDGDAVTIAKDLKRKGAGGGTLKAGTKVRSIRLDPFGPDGHDIDAQVPGFGHMHLKSSVVNKQS